MDIRFPAHADGGLLVGLGIAALAIGLSSGEEAKRPAALGPVKAQAVSRESPQRGLAVVGVARGRRLRIQYAGGCRGLRLRRNAADRKRRFATVVGRNGKRCGRRGIRRGRFRATVCGGGRCVTRRARIARFRDSDGDGLGNLYERFVLHARKPGPGGPGPPAPAAGGGPAELRLPPLGRLGCVAEQTPVESGDELLDAVESGDDACVVAPIGDVALEGLGTLDDVTVSSEGNGSIGAIGVEETSNLTIRGARLRSITIRRANGTRVISSVIGGSPSDRVEDQLIFMPETSRDVAIESNEIGWTRADDTGNTGYGCRCYGTLDRLRFVGNRVHDIAADGFQGVGGSDVLIDRNEIGPVGANPDSSEHSDNIQITGNGPNLRITDNWLHHQGYFGGQVAANSGSTYIHGGGSASLTYENNLIETAQGRTEICGLGSGGDTRSNITIRRNTWVDGGKAFEGFPGFEWDCDSGSGNVVERNVAVDPDGGFALGGSAGAATFSANLWGQPSLVALDAQGNCTSANCNPAGQEPIGYRKPTGVGW